jgi:hypothetical protein
MPEGEREHIATLQAGAAFQAPAKHSLRLTH